MNLRLQKIITKLPKPLRTKKAFAVLAVILVIAFAGNRGKADTDQIKLATVQEKNLSSQVIASGSVKSENSSTLRFPVSGKIIWIPVKEGDSIEQGQAIAQLDASKYQAALRQAQQDVNAYDAVLSQIYDEQKKQSAAENFDQKIRRTAAETNKNKAYDAMIKAQRDLADTLLIAPHAGTITSLKYNVGQDILTTADFVQIDDIDNIKFVAEVDESEIGKVNVGQIAQISLDAYPDKQISGTVSKISKRFMTTSTGATAFEVTTDLPANQNFLIGMNGQAQITAGQAQNVLSVPQEAIIDQNYVWVKKDNDFQKQQVETGLESDTETEITSGLAGGQEILVAGFEQIGKKSLFQKLIRQ